jgi:hypothetical protein
MASTEALEAQLTQLRFERAALLNAERALATLMQLRGEARTLKTAAGLRRLHGAVQPPATSPLLERRSTGPEPAARSRRVLHEICVP